MVAEFATDLIENRLWLDEQEPRTLSTPASDRGSRQLGRRAVVIGAGMGGLSAAGALAKYFMITHYPQPARHGTKQEHRGCFCGFERWRATRCNFKRGSAKASLLFFTEPRISAGRR